MSGRASTAATCFLWRRGSRSATRSGSRCGSSTACGSARCCSARGGGGARALGGGGGVVRLMEGVWERDRGVAHVAAAVLFVVNPYVTVYANRTSVALLA